MRKNIGIRALALVLALATVFGLMPAAAAAPARSDVPAYKTIAEYLEAQKQSFVRIDPAAEVEFIVELADAPLAGSMPVDMKLTDYLATQKGTVQANAIGRQHTIMAAAIENAADVSVTHSYRVVLNGFAVRGAYADKAVLESIPGVKRVAVANTYNLPEPMESGGEPVTSGELIHSDSVNAEGYTGKGTFAAVLDTGLVVEHEAFTADVQGARITGAFIESLSGLNAEGELYRNAKVAFAYDYADGDDDVTDTQGHGTHVAGTIAANGTAFTGVAPDAQLAIMKVFSDEGGASDADILAALEDCVLLGVDTVNMSLGTPCGFACESGLVDDAYNRVREAGINLMVAAGNDFDTAFRNLRGTDLPLAGNPDYGIVGAPSTYAAAMSVASINEKLAYASFFMAGDTRILFDENPESAQKINDLDNTYEYVRVRGVGNANDFAKVDVRGKVALVERGEIAFTEKEQNAYDAGAVAMIVYNNTDADETVYMQLGGLLPAVFISKAEGKLMKDAENKTVTFSPDFSGRMTSPVAGQMSDFSSLGVAPDLSLKPEITAPGGNVWSASISGGYEEMSGTSMAAPHMTGAAAVMRQFVNEAYPGLTAGGKQALIDNLLMSTAVPVEDPSGVPYTPRKQGAGLADISAAVHSGAYLTVNGGKPKAELGESSGGVYEFTFTVHNLTDAAKTYNVSVDAIAAQTGEHDGETCISQLCRAMGADELNVTLSPEIVTVPGNSSADVTVKLALTQKGREALSVFPNGIYVEGFVRLTGDGVIPLGLPYLGFYGNWADAPIFDSTMYDGESSFLVESAIAMMDYNGDGSHLGVNAITGSARAEWISYASKTAGYFLITPMQGLLRAPKEIRYTATSDADPETPVYVMEYGNTCKSFYYTSGGFIYADFVPWEDSWQPIGGSGEEGYYYLPDGPYTYRIDARIDGEEEFQTSTYPVYIDNQGPRVVSHSYEVIDGTPYLTVEVTDNHFVMAAQLVDEDYTRALSPIAAVEETELGTVSRLTFDLTDVQADGYQICRVNLVDYAWNETLSDLMSTVSQNVEPQSIQLSPYVVTAGVDSHDSEIVASIDPAEAVNQTLTWSSTDERVAKVVSVSGDTHSVMVDYVGPGTCQIVATACNGITGSCGISIAKPAASAWPGDNVIREDGFYEIPADLNTTVTITDNARKVWVTGSNTAESPYVNLTLKSENDDLDLTIENLHLSNSANWSCNAGIVFTGRGNTLTLVGENSVRQGEYGSHASISVPSGVELTVGGSGKLTMHGSCNAYGASIGGDAGGNSGKIVIDSGTFVFDSVNQGAGIGGGANGSGDVTISGGTFEMNAPRTQQGGMWNTNYTGACIGSGNAATASGTTKITVNGGDFTGTTGTGSALIGTGCGSACNLIVEINGGVFDLVTEDTDDTASTGGACIGTGQVGYSGTPTADITINGGILNAVSNSDGAAIGGGPGINTGSVYIFGGTVTATATAGGDAIGAGIYPEETTNNIRIHGGTVKATNFGDDTLVNDDSDAVFLVNIEAPDVASVIVDGRDWNVPANHPGDDLLYLYLTASGTAHEVLVDGKAYLVTVEPDGSVTVEDAVKPDLTALEELYAQVTTDWERMARSVFPEELTGDFLEDYQNAEWLLTGAGGTQEDVDEACDGLLSAWEAMKAYPVNSMYTDIAAGTWFYDAVDFVTRYGFMNGMDAGVFNAGGNVNRAQFVVILYRMAGSPEVSVQNPFVDVPEVSWFTDAVLWAYDKGITTGADATHFNPGDTLVRQNMVTLLMRFAKTMGIDTEARADLSGYTDAGQILPHAKDAMQWAVAEGIISGMDETTLAPNGLANRAQIATIISRFVPGYLW